MKTNLEKLLNRSVWLKEQLKEKLWKWTSATYYIKNARRLNWHTKQNIIEALIELEVIQPNEYNPLTLVDYEK